MKQLQKGFIISMLTLMMATSIAMANPMEDGMEPGPGGPGFGPEMMAEGGPGMVAQLNLTSDQIELLKKEKLKKRKSMIQLRSEMELLQVDLAEAAGQDKPDMAKIEKMAKKVGEIHGKMTAERMQSIIYLRSILTDEQKQLMDAQQLHYGGMGGHKGMKSMKDRKGRGKNK